MDRKILIALLAASVLGIVSYAQAGPPTPSVEVTGSVSVDNFPATQNVQGTVQVGNFPSTQAVTGSVQVTNAPGTALSVTISPGDAGALSHVGQPISNHVQFDSRSYSPSFPAEIYPAVVNPSNGGGGTFTLGEGQCLVITEVQIHYFDAEPVNGQVSFWLGLGKGGLGLPVPHRQVFDMPNADGAGQISKTYPSGLVFEGGDPDYNQLALKSFNSIAVYFGATGYVIACD